MSRELFEVRIIRSYKKVKVIKEIYTHKTHQTWSKKYFSIYLQDKNLGGNEEWSILHKLERKQSIKS